MRRFLRETYIGAVTIGMLFFYGIQGLVQSIENPYLMWLARKNQASVLMDQPIQFINKPLLYRTLGEALLYLFFALLLTLLIYSGQPKKAAETPSAKAE